MGVKRISLLVALLMSLSLVAFGHDQTKNDPDDVPGEFDMRKVTFEHAEKLTFKTRVTGTLQKSDFKNTAYFLWSLNTQGDDTFDFHVFLRRVIQGGEVKMKCDIRQNEDLSPVAMRPGTIDGHVGRCVIDPDLVGGVPEEWNATTDKGDNTDVAPQVGRYSH